MKLIKAGETSSGKLRIFFQLVSPSDGITAVSGETGTPQYSINGGTWTNNTTGLTSMSNGRHYMALDSAAVATAGDIVETRYKSSNTAECPGQSVQVVAFDPNDIVRIGLTAFPNVASGSAGALITSGTGTAQLSVSSGVVTVGTINNNVITAASINADAGEEIADAVLSRNVSNVESTMGEHTLGTVILAMLENSISGTTLTIKKTGGTTHVTKTLTVTAASTADVITSIT